MMVVISDGNDGKISLHNNFLVNNFIIIMLVSTERVKLKVYQIANLPKSCPLAKPCLHSYPISSNQSPIKRSSPGCLVMRMYSAE